MRRRYLRLSPQVLEDAFQPRSLLAGFHLRADGIPLDMKIVGCFWEDSINIVLAVESAEFEEVSCGETPPDFNPIFHRETSAQ